MSEQTSLGNTYEKQSCLKASNGLVCSMIQAGLIKPESVEAAFIVEETYYKRYLIRITEGIDTATGVQTGYSTPKIPVDVKMVTVRLKDGVNKTKENKDRLKELGFWWNSPAGSFDWNKQMKPSEWKALSDEPPFNGFTVRVIE